MLIQLLGNLVPLALVGLRTARVIIQVLLYLIMFFFSLSSTFNYSLPSLSPPPPPPPVDSSVRDVEPNGLYGFLWEDEEETTWCRVLVSFLPPSNPHPTDKARGTAMVYFPDYGNTSEVSVDDLLELPARFYQLPFQVRVCLSTLWFVTFHQFMLLPFK